MTDAHPSPAVRYWEEGIQGLLRRKATPVFSLQFLEDMFSRKGLVPKCLKQVIVRGDP